MYRSKENCAENYQSIYTNIYIYIANLVHTMGTSAYWRLLYTNIEY